MKRSLINEEFDNSDVLLWTNDIIDFFFFTNSGFRRRHFLRMVKKPKFFENGAENNNLKYTSIGNVLIKKKYMDKKKVNLFSIKKFLRENSDKVNNILNENDRYIFFKLNTNKKDSPVGAFGINLVPNVGDSL